MEETCRQPPPTMGNAKSGAVSKEILEDLKMNTKFSEVEIVSKDEFEAIYVRFFPESSAQTYARHVFRSFDTNSTTARWTEYILPLHLTSTGKTDRELEWAFSLFDVTKSEVQEICAVSSGGLGVQMTTRVT